MLDLDSQLWHSSLRKGLGADTFPVKVPDREIGVSIFRAGPFRLAYPDFPTGVAAYSSLEMDAIAEASHERRVDMIRFHSREALQLNGSRAPLELGTMLIPSLGSWSESNHEKARRTRNRLGRSNLDIAQMKPSDASRLHHLYLATIERNAGASRYGVSYFANLPNESVIVARLNGEICGFVCVAKRGGVAYYLHGAHDPTSRQYYPSDQLFLSMLRMAQQAGATEFDFLPSPAGGQDLERYKKSWGAIGAPFIVTDLPLRPLHSLALEVGRGIADRLPARWLAKLLRH